MRQVPVGAVEMVGQVGAAFATFLPSRSQHKVINDQLVAILEQVGERFLAVRPFEPIFLVDPDYRELPPRGAERVPLPAEFFLTRQQVLAGDKPLSFRHDLRIHVLCSHAGFQLL